MTEPVQDVADSAGYYDFVAHIYDDLMGELSGKDFAVEADRITNAIRIRLPNASTLLDVGCGTGLHLEHLRAEFTCTGVDLSGGMLDAARGRNPEVTLVQGDMTTFQLPDRFDAVICLFASIAYACTVERLRATAKNLARHVAPDGVLIIEPFFQPLNYEPHRWGNHLQRDDSDVVEIGRSWNDDTTCFIESHFLTNANERIQHFTSVEELGLFTLDEYTDALTQAGFATVSFDPIGLWQDRGLFVATR